MNAIGEFGEDSLEPVGGGIGSTCDPIVMMESSDVEKEGNDNEDDVEMSGTSPWAENNRRD